MKRTESTRAYVPQRLPNSCLLTLAGALCLAFTASPAYPSQPRTYKIGFSFSGRDGFSRSGALIITEGKTVTLNLSHTTLKVTPAPFKRGAVKIDLAILDPTASTRLGTSRTTVITRLGEPAEMVEKDENGKPLFKIRLSPSV